MVSGIVFLVLERLKQEDCEFETSLRYEVRKRERGRERERDRRRETHTEEHTPLVISCFTSQKFTLLALAYE